MQVTEGAGLIHLFGADGPSQVEIYPGRKVEVESGAPQLALYLHVGHCSVHPDFDFRSHTAFIKVQYGNATFVTPPESNVYHPKFDAACSFSISPSDGDHVFVTLYDGDEHHPVGLSRINLSAMIARRGGAFDGEVPMFRYDGFSFGNFAAHYRRVAKLHLKVRVTASHSGSGPA